jgi:hypothetical protein
MGYTNLTSPLNVTSGVSDFFYVALAEDFAANGIKCAAAGEVIITADHTFTALKGFAKIVCSPLKNNLKSEFSGDPGNLKMMEKFKFFVPGSYEALHKSLKLYLNKPVIILVKDAECDTNIMYQGGCDCIYAYLTSGGFDTGTTKDGVKGYELTFEVPSSGVKLYGGAVTLLV